MNMIYVILAEGFEETEAIEPVDIMKRAGLGVTLVSLQDNKYVEGAHGITVKADISVNELVKKDMELLMLPGGPGHTNLDSDVRVHELIDYACENGLYIAAICASPSILGKKGLLSGKKATCFPGFEHYMTGAQLTGEKAVADGKFITGRGAGAAGEFGLKIVEKLKGKELSDKLRRDMQY